MAQAAVNAPKHGNLAVGDHVLHRPPNKFSRDLGSGVIIKPWGCWFFCKDCCHDLAGPDFSECDYCGRMEKCKNFKDRKLSRYVWRCLGCYSEVAIPHHARCPFCHDVVVAVSVNGREIYDVRFGKNIIAVNQCWLKKI